MAAEAWRAAIARPATNAAATNTAAPRVHAVRPAAHHRRTVRQAGSFAIIGVASTLAYVALFAILRTTSPAAIANAMALVLTAIGNTAANRRLTFDAQGRDGLARDHAAGLLAFAIALAITTASLAGLDRVAPGAGRPAELTVLVAANALATVLRFLLLRLALDTDRPRHPADGRHAGCTRPERTPR